MNIVNDPFNEEQERIAQLLDKIFLAGQKKDFELLESYHLYSPKFSKFGLMPPLETQDANASRQEERDAFSSFSEFHYHIQDLKVSVFGPTAVSTFIANIRFSLGKQVVSKAVRSTLVFVKTDQNEWKIVHEHFSPYDKSKDK